MNSNNQSSERSKKTLKYIAIVFLVFGFIGFCDAAYLTIEHYRGVIPPCSVVDGCESVLTSPYAKIAGIPISMFGMAYYFSIIILAIVYLDSRSRAVMRVCAGLSCVGFLTSIFLAYLQVFVIRYICLYCMISAASSAVLFAGGLIAWKRI